MEKEKSFSASAFGLTFSIYPEGQFEKDGESIDYEQGIKLKSGRNAIRLSAIQVAWLRKILCSEEPKGLLNERLLEEQAELDSLLF